jgi:ABC-type Fe3+/spermidine/putrescine transport system ATPase subunit
MEEPFLAVDVGKLYPEFEIQVSLQVNHGEFFTLIGPSGCGKTTLLRLIAGLEKIDRGVIRLDGREITEIPAAERHIGLVFQEYALFPHLTVAQNIEYGLQVQKISSPARKSRLRDLLTLFELESLAGREIHQISGGERQRVAIARALAPNPLILLMDEPFSALDYSLRQRLQQDLLRIQKNLGFTVIFVTHQQEEALSLSDRLAIMQKGSIVQIGTPQEIYNRPSNRFVGEFLGDANVIPCVINHNHNQSRIQLESLESVDFFDLPELQNYKNGQYLLMVRPEDLEIGDQSGRPMCVTLPVEITGLEYLGYSYRIEALYGEYKIKALLRKDNPPPSIGMKVNLLVNPSNMRILRS